MAAVERGAAGLADGTEFYPTIHHKAAALCESLAHNHPFVEGNKRTAWLATTAFYALNGYLFDPMDTEMIELILALTQGYIDVPAAADSFRRWAIKLADVPEEFDAN